MAAHENHRRSFAKSLSYTGAVIVADLLIIFLVTHHVDTTVELIVLTNVVSLIIYYLHARLWAHVKWGIRRSR